MAHKKKENVGRKRKPIIPYVRVQPTKKQKEKKNPFAWNETIQKMFENEV